MERWMLLNKQKLVSLEWGFWVPCSQDVQTSRTNEMSMFHHSRVVWIRARTAKDVEKCDEGWVITQVVRDTCRRRSTQPAYPPPPCIAKPLYVAGTRYAVCACGPGRRHDRPRPLDERLSERRRADLLTSGARAGPPTRCLPLLPCAPYMRPSPPPPLLSKRGQRNASFAAPVRKVRARTTARTSFINSLKQVSFMCARRPLLISTVKTKITQLSSFLKRTTTNN